MAKTRKPHPTRRPAPRRVDDESARFKRELARQLRERRQISHLSKQLERAMQRARVDALGLARFIAIENGYTFVARESSSEEAPEPALATAAPAVRSTPSATRSTLATTGIAE